MESSWLHMPHNRFDQISMARSDTLLLRGIAIFLVAFVSWLGCLSAQYIGSQPGVMQLLKSFSFGVVLSIGFCHVLADAETSFKHVEYPAPMVCSLVFYSVELVCLMILPSVFLTQGYRHVWRSYDNPNEPDS